MTAWDLNRRYLDAGNDIWSDQTSRLLLGRGLLKQIDGTAVARLIGFHMTSVRERLERGEAREWFGTQGMPYTVVSMIFLIQVSTRPDQLTCVAGY